VICHATSDRQAMTIADNIEERLARDLRVKPSSIEGRRRAEWILMDYIDFVVHVFLAEKREFYRLESLWGDAPRIELDALALPPAEESTERKTSSA
jgi:ribosome-associated protein